MQIPTPSPSLEVPRGLALSDTEKAEALADGLGVVSTGVRPVGPGSYWDGEWCDAHMRVYPFKWTETNHTLGGPTAIRGLKVGKAPGPNGEPNSVLRHLHKRLISFLTKVFNAVLRRQYFPSAWKHARVVSVLHLGKDLMLPSSYRPISLLHTIGNLFEKILLTRVLW
jgi:hypothetical protein